MFGAGSSRAYIDGVTNAQLYIAVAIPSVLFLLGIVTSLVTCFLTVSGLQKRTDRVQSYTGLQPETPDTSWKRMQDSMDIIQRDQRELYAKQAVHDAEIANLKTRRS